MIQKQGILSRVNSCFNGRKLKVFCIVSWPATKSAYTTIILRSWGKPGHASRLGANPNIHGLKLLLRIWWDQLGVVYHELLKNQPKPSQENAIDYNWYVWAEHRRKNSRYTSRDTSRGICDMTKLSQMLQNVWISTWKRLNRKSYTLRRIHQILPVWLSVVPIDGIWPGWAALSFLWRCQMGRSMVSLKRRVVFPTWSLNVARKMGKSNG